MRGTSLLADRVHVVSIFLTNVTRAEGIEVDGR